MTTMRSLLVDSIYGVSTQDTAYQSEAKDRLHLPYDLLSDEKLNFARALNLPTFEWKGKQLIKRLALVVRDGLVEKVFYPVFPPDKNAEEVVKWLEGQKPK
jgi:peroxiredoxin